MSDPATEAAPAEEKARDGDRDRHRDRDRDRDRDRPRDRDRDRDRDRHRDRDRDRDRHRDRDRDRDRSSRRSRSKDRDRRRRSRSRSREKSPVVEKTAEELEAERQAEEIEDLTKDQRTVFVSQLVMKADERSVRKFFEKVGKVKQVIMIRDKYTNRHKGFAYVEMAQLDSIPLVLMLHNAVPDFQKFPILIKASEAEKNFLEKQSKAVAAAAERAKVQDRLYVGNLHEHIGEDDLRTVLAHFGAIDSIKITRDEAGKSKGFGFVKFAREDDAKTAKEKLDAEGLELLGKVLKVGFVNDQGGGQGNTAGGGPGNWKLDDSGSQGVALDANSRLALMARLGGGALGLPGLPPPGGLPLPGMPMPGAMPGMLPGMGMPGMPPAMPNMPPAMPLPIPGAMPGIPAVAPIAGDVSFAIQITNMFDPASETEPGWEIDIKEDTEQECSKFGSVLHCFVETRQPGGIVYVLFGSAEGASKAANHLHGRWFAGRTITIAYLAPDAYAAKVPDSAGAVATAKATAANAGL